MTNGGRHPGSGRHKRDTVRVTCSIPRPVFDAVVAREAREGIYRCRIIASLVCEGLTGGVVDSELRAVCQSMHGAEPPLTYHLGNCQFGDIPVPRP